MGNVRIIAASAGSGKTYRLAYEYVRAVVEDPTLYRRILAVTFTNKATEEMASRILVRLNELATPGARSPYMADLRRELGYGEEKIRARAREARGRILHDYSRFSVFTIDRFFQRLVRAFMRELGLEGGFDLSLETDSLLEMAADALIERIPEDERVREGVFDAARRQMELGRRWDIRGPLVSLGRELFGESYLRAGQAGEDATVALKIIDAVAERAVAAGTHMSELAKNALGAIGAAGLSGDEFKGLSKGLGGWLRRVAGDGFTPLSAYARQAAESDDPTAWCAKNSPAHGAIEGLIPTLRPILQEMDTVWRDNRRLVASAALLAENRHNFRLLHDLQRAVERICREENIVPISETNRMIARLVAGGDTPFIFEKAGGYFSRYLIDEFQDTSHSQWENFVPLLRDAIASERGTPVMLIGDVKQAIYRWRGSDWRILSQRVRAEMGAERVETETLDTNHRSARAVVEFNNEAVGRIVAADSAALDAVIEAAREEGALSADEAAELTGVLAAAYEGHTQRVRPDREGGYVTLATYGPDDAGEYVPPVVERIEELQSRGYRAGEIAVLVRTNTQGAEVARMILDRKRLNPDSPYRYDVVTQDALKVGTSAVCRFVVACLRLSQDAGDDIRRAVYNRFLGRGFGAAISADETAFLADVGTLSPEEAFERIVVRFGLDGRARDMAWLQALHQQIAGFGARHVADTPLFLKWWEEKGARASITMQQHADAITVTTIHKSKGLQYRAVVVPWLSWAVGPDTRGKPVVLWARSEEGEMAEAGAVPVNYKKEMAASFFSADYYRELAMAHIDAVNMFYVAATRAERELHLMVPDNPRDPRDGVGFLLRRVMGVEEGFAEWGAPEHPELEEAPAETSANPDTSDVSAAEDMNAPDVSDGSAGSGSSGVSGVSVEGRDGAEIVMRNYPTRPPGKRVRLRLPSARYAEDGADGSLSPRDFGVLMHRALEGAQTVEDVRRALGRMAADALVSPAEQVRLAEMIEGALTDPRVAEWFGGGWTEVRNENEIVLPRSAAAGAEDAERSDIGRDGMRAPSPHTRRPDRVMVRDGRAVVVDYKFGRNVHPSHAAQLRGYMRLLGRMGYAETEGYLWYVSQGKIETVSRS